MRPEIIPNEDLQLDSEEGNEAEIELVLEAAANGEALSGTETGVDTMALRTERKMV